MRRFRLRGLVPKIAWAMLLVLATSPAWGYIVFLKDGSQITTKDKPRIEGDKAILVLPSGTEAFYDAAEIDFEKTEEVNVVNYGTARIIEGLETQRLGDETRFEPDEQSFGDFLAERGRGLALPEVRKREAKALAEGELPTTQAGFVDLMALRREPYPHSDVTGEVLSYLKGRGLDSVRIFQGTRPDRPFIEIVAASEASVFKALEDSAAGFVQIHDRFADRVSAFELLLMTESQDRAGQFLLTPERAGDLAGGRISVPAFFLRYVEF